MVLAIETQSDPSVEMARMLKEIRQWTFFSVKEISK